MSTPATPDAVGVVLAAGMGTRVGADGNKAYLDIAGRSMVSWSLSTVADCAQIDRVVLVYRRGERELAEDTVKRELPDTVVEFVEGGDTRHGSEFNVLQHLADDIESGRVDVVVIHDAARPVADPDMVGSALTLARECGGAIPAVPVADVVTAVGADIAALTAPGSPVRVQTPQAFAAAPLLAAYRAADRDGFEGTDTSSCIEAYTDVEVHTFPGAQRNLKVTYARDIAVAARLLTNPAMQR